jgi:membrane protease subunit (stomatin/prohibitin family)
VGIFDKIMGEFVDIIEWLDSTNDTMVYRFQRYNNEIKMGAKLTVRPGQKAVLINEGRIADSFEPGLHQLSTQNLPILSTLMGWAYGFNSPFKAEVYFFNTKNFVDLKWGTSNPIIIRDPELGPIRLRAYGTYNIRITQPEILLQELISTDGLFQVEELSDQIRNMILTSFTTGFASAHIPLFDFAARYTELGEIIQTSMQPEVQRFGLELTQLLIENVSLPEEIEAALDKKAAIGMLGNMQQYTQYQAANAIEQSAQNPSGGNSALDFGVGIAMGQQLTNTIQSPSSPTTPPPPPVPALWHMSRNGQNLGPFSVNQLQQNGLTAQDFVWRAGMSNWQPASMVAELTGLFPPPPPPPPISNP